jgi:hypothetical protein
VKSPAYKLWIRHWGMTLGGGLLALIGGTLAAIAICTETFPRLGAALGFTASAVGAVTLIKAKHDQRRYHRRIWSA